jgi:hypothetical protein
MSGLHGNLLRRTPVVFDSYRYPLVAGWTSYISRPVFACDYVEDTTRPTAYAASRRRYINQVIRDDLGPRWSLLESAERGQTSNGPCKGLHERCTSYEHRLALDNVQHSYHARSNRSYRS